MPIKEWLSMTKQVRTRQTQMTIKTWWQISCDVWFGWIFNAVMAIVFAVLRK